MQKYIQQFCDLDTHRFVGHFKPQNLRNLWFGSSPSQTQISLSMAHSIVQKDGGRDEGGIGRAAFAYLRFMLNALPTTGRTQEGPADCIFGCPDCSGRDELQHYTSCPRARRIIRLATAEPKPQFVFSDEDHVSCM